MSKKRLNEDLKSRRRIGFPAYELFPPNDILGSYLLSLMSAYNDVVRISDWMHAYQHIPRDDLAKKLDNNRRSMQWRLVLGILHEARETLNKLKRDPVHFQKLWGVISNDGRMAAQGLEKHLTWDSTDSARSLAEFLEIVRKRGAFHYVPKHFREGLKQLREAFGDIDDDFILEGSPSRGRLRFSFADTVRNAAAFGADRDVKKLNEELERQINALPDIVKLLNTFLQEAFKAQCVLRGYVLTKHGEQWYLRPNSPERG